MNRAVILAACVLVSVSELVGCRCPGQLHPVGPSASPSIAWAECFADRELMVATDTYAAYAATSQGAEELGAWMDAEITEFRARHPNVPVARGIAAAIESGEEPALAVSAWEEENVDRRSCMLYSLAAAETRPYSLFREPYFRESFMLPPEQALPLGLVDTKAAPPGWICFLATDTQVTRAFDRKLHDDRKLRVEQMEEHLRKYGPEMPVSDLIDNCLAYAIFFLRDEEAYPKFRSIDLELMHLQRREALWAAWLSSGIAEPSQRESQLAALRRETGAEWERIWDRRPIEE